MSRTTIRTTIILLLALMASLILVITRQALIDCGGSSIKAEDAATAIKCLVIPAHLGDTDTKEMLGVIYAYGIGTAPDFELAKKWLSKLTYPDAGKQMLDIGNDYLYGTRAPKNVTTAKAWFREAAQHGNDEAKRRCEDLGCQEWPVQNH